MIIRVNKKYNSYAHELEANRENKMFKACVNGLNRRSFWRWLGKSKRSTKEKEISKILLSLNIRFYTEVSFDKIKRYDFYIPMLDLIIEYDGRQHFSRITDIKNDIYKDGILEKLGVKLIR